jgi:hypothetical protein
LDLRCKLKTREPVGETIPFSMDIVHYSPQKIIDKHNERDKPEMIRAKIFNDTICCKEQRIKPPINRKTRKRLFSKQERVKEDEKRLREDMNIMHKQESL